MRTREKLSWTLGCGLFALLVSVGLILLASATHNIADEQTREQQAPIVANDPAPDAPVTCDNAPMSRNNLCDHIITTGGGGQITLHYSYDEQQQYLAKQRIQQEMDRKAAQRNKTRPPTALIGLASVLLWIVGGAAGLLTLLFFLSFVLNILTLFRRSESPTPETSGSDS